MGAACGRSEHVGFKNFGMLRRLSYAEWMCLYTHTRAANFASEPEGRDHGFDAALDLAVLLYVDYLLPAHRAFERLHALHDDSMMLEVDHYGRHLAFILVALHLSIRLPSLL